MLFYSPKLWTVFRPEEKSNKSKNEFKNEYQKINRIYFIKNSNKEYIFTISFFFSQYSLRGKKTLIKFQNTNLIAFQYDKQGLILRHIILRKWGLNKNI